LPAERDLAQRFGVSRTAVREAVKTLREKGLVEAYSGRGTFVTNGTSQAMRQSLDLMIRINQQEGSTRIWPNCGWFWNRRLPALALPELRNNC
jgi:GntR family transcriptional regulator, transcriptional repressor for pyruvate dehydrogenase complex